MKHLITFLALALLGGCGGQNPNGALPQTPASTQAHRASSSSGDILYIVTLHAMVLVAYPEWKLLGSISNQNLFNTVCSDPNTGNVFVPENYSVVEYSHGETTPVATLTVPSSYGELSGCSVDPTTGNLAVSAEPGVLIWSHAQGTPVEYTSKDLRYYFYTAYDNQGNLYVAARNKGGKFRFGELKSGHKQFIAIRLELDPVSRTLR
jgi:hypothetical protein